MVDRPHFIILVDVLASHVMGNLEKEAKVVRRNTSIQRIILQTIATAGFMSVTLLAPNALQALRIFDGGKRRKLDPKYFIGSTFEKLYARGLVSIEHSQKGKVARLTKEGEKALARMVLRTPQVKTKRWDKRWRIVIYDIKEKRRGTRILLRRTLETFGFCRLQHSVWLYPHDCEEVIMLLKAHFKIGQEVLYMIVEKIENDQKYREYFNLK